MAEYIDREATLNAIENAFDRETILNRFVRKIAIIAVKKMPAANVRPVVRGEWIPAPAEYEGETANIWWKCSVCGQKIYSETERDRKEFHAFCSRCGADMRVVDDG